MSVIEEEVESKEGEALYDRKQNGSKASARRERVKLDIKGNFTKGNLSRPREKILDQEIELRAMHDQKEALNLDIEANNFISSIQKIG